MLCKERRAKVCRRVQLCLNDPVRSLSGIIATRLSISKAHLSLTFSLAAYPGISILLCRLAYLLIGFRSNVVLKLEVSDNIGSSRKLQLEETYILLIRQSIGHDLSMQEVRYIEESVTCNVIHAAH